MADAGTLAARIVRAMAARGARVDVGPGERNIVYVRRMDANGAVVPNTANGFDDLRTVLEFVDGQPKIIRAWPATVEPGVKYVKGRINPKGAAFIVDGQQRAWQVDMHRGHHEALCQRAGPVTVSRDDNEDQNPAGDELDTGWFGINQHGGYDAAQDNIGGASAGCLVVPAMRDQAEFMALVKADPRYRADSKFVFSTTVMSAAEVLADGPLVAAQLVAAGASGEQRRRMALAIVNFEAQRDSAGHIKVYNPPANDGGGAYEIAGINVRYHPQEAQKLKALIEAGRHAEAEDEVIAYVAAYTDVAAGWSSDAGVESYLRDCVFNRGPGGAARILQRAVGVNDDGVVGPITRAAVASLLGARS